MYADVFYVYFISIDEQNSTIEVWKLYSHYFLYFHKDESIFSGSPDKLVTMVATLFWYTGI